MASETTIDKAGRFVIPKALRDALGLRAGSRLCAHVEGDRLVLEVVRDAPALAEKGGLLVAAGELRGRPADHRELRDSRIRRLAAGDP